MEVLSRVIRNLVIRHEAEVRTAMAKLHSSPDDIITVLAGGHGKPEVKISRAHPTPEPSGSGAETASKPD